MDRWQTVVAGDSPVARRLQVYDYLGARFGIRIHCARSIFTRSLPRKDHVCARSQQAQKLPGSESRKGSATSAQPPKQVPMPPGQCAPARQRFVSSVLDQPAYHPITSTPIRPFVLLHLNYTSSFTVQVEVATSFSRLPHQNF
jgi:hypothetical protein